MPILSANGRSEVLKKMDTKGIGDNSTDLYRSINRDFFQKAFKDQLINLESLEDKGFNFKVKPTTQELNKQQIEDLLENCNFYKTGFSPDVVENFFYRKRSIQPKTFKDLCTFLGLTYNEVVENTKNVNLSTSEFTLRDVLVSKFNHEEKRRGASQLGNE